MRKGLVVIFLGYILLLIETALGDMFQFGLIRLDGIVPLIAWYGLNHGLPGGILPVLGLGVLSDPLSGLPAGLYSLGYAGEYLMIRYIVNHAKCAAPWQQMLLVSFVSIEVVTVLLTGSGAAEIIWPWGLIQALINGITAPLWFVVFDKAGADLFRFKPAVYSGEVR